MASVIMRIGGRLLLPVAAALMLAACQARPLYAPTAFAPGLSVSLETIEFAPVDDRVSQQVVTELASAFGTGTNPPAALYTLHIRASSAGALAVSTSRDPRVGVSVRATYRLVEIATGRVVTSGTAASSTSYQRAAPAQAFAEVRARRDAEDRAAATAAERIRLQVALALTGA